MFRGMTTLNTSPCMAIPKERGSGVQHQATASLASSQRSGQWEQQPVRHNHRQRPRQGWWICWAGSFQNIRIQGAGSWGYALNHRRGQCRQLSRERSSHPSAPRWGSTREGSMLSGTGTKVSIHQLCQQRGGWKMATVAIAWGHWWEWSIVVDDNPENEQVRSQHSCHRIINTTKYLRTDPASQQSLEHQPTPTIQPNSYTQTCESGSWDVAAASIDFLSTTTTNILSSNSHLLFLKLHTMAVCLTLRVSLHLAKHLFHAVDLSGDNFRPLVLLCFPPQLPWGCDAWSRAYGPLFSLDGQLAVVVISHAHYQGYINFQQHGLL